MTLNNIHLYIQVSCLSTTNRDAFSSTRLVLTLRHRQCKTLCGQCAKWETLKHSVLDRMPLSNPSSPSSCVYVRWGRNVTRTRGSRWLQVNCLPDTMVVIHIIHSLWQCTQTCSRSNQTKYQPALKRGSGQKSWPIQGTVCIITVWGRKKVSFLKWNVTDHFTHYLGQASMPRSSGQSQNGLLFYCKVVILV